MPRSRQETSATIRRQKNKGCKAALCCSCRISVSSSSDEQPESSSGHRFHGISSIAHALVQERLDDMIRERRQQEDQSAKTRRRRRVVYEEDTSARRRSRRPQEYETKFVVMMVAMEKASYDPREDFRRSMEEMIVTNKIRNVKDLRRLLDYYVRMNSDEFRGVIFEVFHHVCTYLFL